MSLTAQHLVIAVAVIAALTYLVVYYLRRRRKRSQCDDCTLHRMACDVDREATSSSESGKN